MLVKHIITEQLYKYGYNGVDNICDYWLQHRNDIIKYMGKSRNKMLKEPEIMTNFELKIRWSTLFGMWFRFYIRVNNRLSKSVFDFQEISVRYGGKEHFLKDFLSNYKGTVNPIDQVDLRGISLIKYTFINTEIRNVDFTEATLDSSEFSRVMFINCRFVRTSFNQSKLTECCFDESCIFFENDFTNAHLDCQFDCDLYKPIIKRPRLLRRLSMKIGKEPFYLDYTRIINSSFLAHIIDE